MNNPGSYSRFDDNTLLYHLKQGSRQAFSEIYERYWNKLLAIAYHHTQSKAIAEEIVQDVFLSLWKRHSIVVIHSIEHYLATAIKFAVFDHLLKERRRNKLLADNYLAVPSYRQEEKIQAKFLEEYIRGVVESLPGKCRLVFIYSRDMGLSNEAIARELDISVKTVEAHITKALRIIRTSLKDTYLPAAGLLTLGELFSLLKEF